MAIDEAARSVTSITKAEAPVFRISPEQSGSDGTLALSIPIMVRARLYTGGHARLGNTYSASGPPRWRSRLRSRSFRTATSSPYPGLGPP